MSRPSIRTDIIELIRKYEWGGSIELDNARNGSFNVTYRVDFIGCSLAIRIPKCGCHAMFPEESVRNEGAVLRYIQASTAIPVPFLYHCGTAKDAKDVGGPFLLMEYVTHKETLKATLNTPGRGKDQRPMLNPGIDSDSLEKVYGEIGSLLLHLSRSKFASIGALAQTDDETWQVKYRPVTLQMNELVRIGSMPRSNLLGPEVTFRTSSDYFQHLANEQLEHLRQQRNAIIDDEADCRRKFVARKLFQKLAREDKLANPAYRSGHFRLWSDSLGPGSVLTSGGGQVAAVVGWEFTYAAPAEFTFAPPWWLILEAPERWQGGYDDWECAFSAKLAVFLRVLREREDAGICAGWLTEEQRLSDKMLASWESGDFWLMYAMRRTFVFDRLYWAKLDQRFFGPLTVSPENAWKERLHLLDESELSEMEELVVRKLEEQETQELRWEPDEVWPLDNLE